MYPCVVRPVLEEVVEPALKKSFVLLAEAGHSPQELIDQAWAEAQQDGRALRWLRPRRARTNGGCEHFGLLSVYPSLRDTDTPSHCGACAHAALPARWQGKRQCRCCSTLRSTTMTSANGVAMSRASTRWRAQGKEFGLGHTYELGRFCPSMLAVGAAHPACWRSLHAAEHLSSPETGHARCCWGPRSVDRVPGGVRGGRQKHAAVGGDPVQGRNSLPEEGCRGCRV